MGEGGGRKAEGGRRPPHPGQDKDPYLTPASPFPPRERRGSGCPQLCPFSGQFGVNRAENGLSSKGFILKAKRFSPEAKRFALKAFCFSSKAFRFALPSKRFTPKAKCFALKAFRFISKAKRFASPSKRFILKAKRFALKAFRFVLKAKCFISKANRFALKAKRFAPAATPVRSRLPAPRILVMVAAMIFLPGAANKVGMVNAVFSGVHDPLDNYVWWIIFGRGKHGAK